MTNPICKVIKDVVTGEITVEPMTDEEIAELTPVVSVPREVTAWQGKTALEMDGHLLDIETIIMSMSGQTGASARKDWFSATSWKRDWPLIKYLQQINDWSDEYVDQLFITASNL
jgi:hypothetical protein